MVGNNKYYPQLFLFSFHFLLVKFCVLIVDCIFCLSESFVCLKSWYKKHDVVLTGRFTFWDCVNFLVFSTSLASTVGMMEDKAMEVSLSVALYWEA